MCDLVHRFPLLHRQLCLIAKRFLDVCGPDSTHSLGYSLALLRREAMLLLRCLLQALQNKVNKFTLFKYRKGFCNDR